MKLTYVIITATLLSLSGCMTAAQHRDTVDSNKGDELTVGKVQREIRVGMSGAEVIQVLGSPNIVSTDEKRREVWVYDKVSTESVYSKSSGGINVLVFGGSGGGLLGGSSSAGAASTTQKTLTIIIKFDEKGMVRDFAYNTSRF